MRQIPSRASMGGEPDLSFGAEPVYPLLHERSRQTGSVVAAIDHEPIELEILWIMPGSWSLMAASAIAHAPPV